jgi:exopolyphosphatase/guanosine-5'-triphosphate,3'-diphosphate pyrophosphatase
MPTSAGEVVVRVAAVDCGTNSVRLLVADLDPSTGRQVDVDRQLRIVRLGEGVDAAGRLAPGAVDRLLAVCDEYAAVIAHCAVTRARACATSAARDVAERDGHRLVDAVRERLGVDVEVISGVVEARLTAAGAVRGVHGLSLPEPLLVVDVGGGSTELATSDGHFHSLPVGAVRLTERLMSGERAGPHQVRAVEAVVDRALRGVWPSVATTATVPQSMVAVGGTAVTVAGYVLGVGREELERVHRAQIGLDDVVAACRELASASVTERAALACMHPGRADVIGAGAVVLERVVAAVRPVLHQDSLVVSTHDILDGIAWSVAS